MVSNVVATSLSAVMMQRVLIYNHHGNRGASVIPDIVFAFYELMFAACATMIVVGGSFERGRVLPSIIFGFCWCTVCYCPIAYWTWNANGWLYTYVHLLSSV